MTVVEMALAPDVLDNWLEMVRFSPARVSLASEMVEKKIIKNWRLRNTGGIRRENFYDGNGGERGRQSTFIYSAELTSGFYGIK